MIEPMYSLRQVAEFTESKLHTVRRWVAHEQIPVERIGPTKLKRVRVRRSVLIALFPHLSLSLPQVTQSVPLDADNR